MAYVALTCLIVGVLLGWFLKSALEDGRDSPASDAATELAEVRSNPDVTMTPVTVAPAPSADLPRLLQSIAALDPDSRIAAVTAFETSFGRSFSSRLYVASCYVELGEASAAVDTLLGAALLVRTSEEQFMLERQLSITMDELAKMLVGRNRIDELDRLYEDITLALPELADFFLELGLLRIRTGDPVNGLVPLAQIENHPRLGAQARALIARIEADDTDTGEVLEEVPLRVAGSQFIVEAIIDGVHPVNLLIDTGAAMTVVDPGVLARFGYALDGPRAYFRTAGGVVEAPLVDLGHLALGATGRSYLTVGSLAMDMPAGIDGLLGMNFLRHFEFRIDQEGNVLYLTSHRRPSP